MKAVFLLQQFISESGLVNSQKRVLQTNVQNITDTKTKSQGDQLHTRRRNSLLQAWISHLSC